MLRCWVVGIEQLWLAEVSHPHQEGQTQSLADPGNPLWVQYQMRQALSQANSWDRAWMTQVRAGKGAGFSNIKEAWGDKAQVTTLPTSLPSFLPRKPAFPSPHGLGHVDGTTLLVHSCAPQ